MTIDAECGFSSHDLPMGMLLFFWNSLVRGVRGWTEGPVWSLSTGLIGLSGATLIGSRFWSSQYLWPGIMVVVVTIGLTTCGGAYRWASDLASEATDLAAERDALLTELRRAQAENARRLTESSDRPRAAKITLRNARISSTGGGGILLRGGATLDVDGLDLYDIGGPGISAE